MGSILLSLSVNVLILSVITFVLMITGVNGEDEIVTLQSSTNPVAKGGVTEVLCDVAREWAQSTIIWHQTFGSRRVEIARNTILNNAVGSLSNRYNILTHASSDPSGHAEQLTIKDAAYEDTSQISCMVRDQKPATFNLAICDDDFESEWCRCIQQVGWNDPDCLEKPGNLKRIESNCKRTVTGLGVCLGIAIVYGIIASIVVGWDCMLKMSEKRKKKMEAMKARAAARKSKVMYEDEEKFQIDPNDSITQDVQDEYPPLQRKAEIEQQAREYERLQQQHRSTAQTHVNGAYQGDDDDRPQVQTKAAVINGYVGYSLQEHPRHDQPAYRDAYTPPEYEAIQQTGDVRPKHAVTNDIPAPAATERQYGRRHASRLPQESSQLPARGDNSKSPGEWSVHSDRTPYGHQRDAPTTGRQVYSERPSKDHHPERNGAPRRLDFAESIPRYSNMPDLSGPQIDSTDTVV